MSPYINKDNYTPNKKCQEKENTDTRRETTTRGLTMEERLSECEEVIKLLMIHIGALKDSEDSIDEQDYTDDSTDQEELD